MTGIVLIVAALLLAAAFALCSAGSSSRDNMIDYYLLGRTRPTGHSRRSDIKPR